MAGDARRGAVCPYRRALAPIKTHRHVRRQRTAPNCRRFYTVCTDIPLLFALRVAKGALTPYVVLRKVCIRALCGVVKSVHSSIVLDKSVVARGIFDGRYGKCNGMVFCDSGVGVVCTEMVAFHAECMCHCPLCCRPCSVCGFAAVLEAFPCLSCYRSRRVLADGAFSQAAGKTVGKAYGSQFFAGYDVLCRRVLAEYAGVYVLLIMLMYGKEAETINKR